MSNGSQFDLLVDIVRRLRAPDGCPWDREQTLHSLTPYVIEEAYELVDAMKRGDRLALREELGDVLLHVVMLGLMGEETTAFCLSDVITGISEKMIRRHPHLFGSTQVSDSDEVIKNWDAIKATEDSHVNRGLLDSIPAHLPALFHAEKLQKKAAKVGFDWPDHFGAFDKLIEEFNELKVAIKSENQTHIEEEFGDLLFCLVNIGRKCNIDCEDALQNANLKFRKQFNRMEQLSSEAPASFKSIDDWEPLWTHAKESE